MTHVKICGFQSPEHVIAAIDAGADAIGLVFIPSARRCLPVGDAKGLLEAVRAHYGGAVPEIAGLFGDQPADEVRETIADLQLDSAQLCGAEDVGYASQLDVGRVYKVIGIDPDIPVSAQMSRLMVLQHRHTLAGHRIVIDTKVTGEYGGTGRTFDWGLAAELARGLDFSLAGGLDPENVGDAVRLVKPWGVDTSSGVETDGVKDIGKIEAFVAAVREADGPAEREGLFSGVARLLRRARA